MLLGSQLHDLWRSLHEGGIFPPQHGRLPWVLLGL